jgi:hypothetical protein
MTTPATPENAPGPVLLPTPEVVQAQQLLARQQLAVAMDRARTAATQTRHRPRWKRVTRNTVDRAGMSPARSGGAPVRSARSC